MTLCPEHRHVSYISYITKQCPNHCNVNYYKCIVCIPDFRVNLPSVGYFHLFFPPHSTFALLSVFCPFFSSLSSPCTVPVLQYVCAQFGCTSSSQSQEEGYKRSKQWHSISSVTLTFFGLLHWILCLGLLDRILVQDYLDLLSFTLRNC